MTTKIKWRLSKLPDTMEVATLVKEGLLSKEEAREILFSLENEADRDKASLQEEIKFLRELVAKLSTQRTQIVDQIKFIEKPYRKQEWYKPYDIWCLNDQQITYSTTSPANMLYMSATGSQAQAFDSIKTF